MAIRYSREENLIDSVLDNDERTVIREQIAVVEPGAHLFAVSYETRKHRELQGIGWDIRMVRMDGSEAGIEYKKRRPVWINNAGVDFAIETYDANRPNGEGWFVRYDGKGVAYLVFVWKSCEEQDNGGCTKPDLPDVQKCIPCKVPRTWSHISIFRNLGEEFFSRVKQLDSEKHYRSWGVDEAKRRDGAVGRVGGFILPLYDIVDLRVFDSRDTPLNEYWKSQGWGT